jgi:hypothetical protein
VAKRKAVKPVDDLEGLDDYDRMLAADMDANRPHYGEEDDEDDGDPPLNWPPADAR